MKDAHYSDAFSSHLRSLVSLSHGFGPPRDDAKTLKAQDRP